MDDSLSSSGGRLTAKGQVTRRRILAVAADLFREHGAAGTSVDDVRRAAAVSGSQLGHYFLDKRSLIRAVIAWQMDEVVAELYDRELRGLSSFGALRAWADRSVQIQIDQDFRGGYTMGSLFTEALLADDEIRKDVAATFERWQRVFVEGIDSMRDRGELRGDADPAVLGLTLLSAYQGGCTMSEAVRDPRPLRDTLYAAIDYVYSFAEAGIRSPLPKQWGTRRSLRAVAQ